MRLKFIAFAALTLGVSATGLSQEEEGDQQNQKKMEQIESWEVLKEECARLSGDNQIKPFKVEISCRVADEVWQQAQQAEDAKATHTLANERSIGASVTMKNKQLAEKLVPADLEDVNVDCNLYDQYRRTAGPFTATVECADIEQIEDLHAHCLQLVEERIDEGGDEWTLEPTGVTYDSCRGRSEREAGRQVPPPSDVPDTEENGE